jgi:cell pole-organizing protein PopZ
VRPFLSQADDVESEMNQPAKAQEPSMEEILASIRRIISDDEAKPAAATATVNSEPAKPAGAKAEPPRPTPVPEPKPAAPKPAAAAPAKAPEPAAKSASAPAEKNSQAEIDAMMASFDAPEPAAPSVDEADSDVFELTEQMAMPELPPVAFQKVEPEDDLEFAESASPPPPPATRIDPPSYGQSARSEPVEIPGMLSNTTAASVESAFNALASTVLSNNARTLEDLVKEMLRPMLKAWLDDNLPSLVERIVRAEIERVSRGR